MTNKTGKTSSESNAGNEAGHIYQFPDRKIVDQEAAEWLIKLDSDKPLTPSEEKALTEWLARSPVHRDALNQLNIFWGNNVLTELIAPSENPQIDTSQQRGESAMGLFAGLAQSLKRFLSSSQSLTAAVMVGVALTLSLLIGGKAITDSNGLYVTAVGQQKTIEMADGSRLQLNTNSQVEINYNNNFRNIRLIQGEVHFEVAKNPQVPFRVYAGSGRVQAVGTAFTVYLKDKDVDVLVTEGRVALASLAVPTREPTKEPIGEPVEVPVEELDKARPQSDAKAKEHNKDKTEKAVINPEKQIDTYANSLPQQLAELNAGQAATLTSAPQAGEPDNSYQLLEQTISDEEFKRRQSWRSGLLVFSGEPLQQVVNEVSRYTTVTIDIADPELSQIEIGGRFRVGDMEDMFNALEANFGVKVKRLAYNHVQLASAR